MTVHQDDDGRRNHPTQEGIAGAAAELSTLQRILVGPLWDEVQQELAKLRKENQTERERVAAQLKAHSSMIDEHDTRLDALSKAKTQERRLVPAAYLDHQDIGRQINTLADQVLLDIAVNAAGTGDPRQEAELIGFIARRLFSTEAPCPDADALARQLCDSGHQVHPERLRRVCELAGDIRARAAATGHTIDWDFTLPPSELLDPERQQPHIGCDAEGVADFVTVPGYLADGRPYVKQRVFTRLRKAETLQPEPSAAPPEADEPATPLPPGPVVLLVRLARVREELGQSDLPSLQDLVAAIKEARPSRTARLSAAPIPKTAAPHKHVVIEADGNETCTITVVDISDTTEVEIRGHADDVVASAQWFHAELPRRHFQVSFKRTEPAPWTDWRGLPPDSDEPPFKEFLLGDEPVG